MCSRNVFTQIKQKDSPKNNPLTSFKFSLFTKWGEGGLWNEERKYYYT